MIKRAGWGVKTMKTEKQRLINEILDIVMQESGSGVISMEDALIHLYNELRTARGNERDCAELLSKQSDEKEALERIVLNMAKEFFK